MPGGGPVIQACDSSAAVHVFSSAEMASYSDYTALRLSFAFPADPPATAAVFVLDPNGAPLVFAPPVPARVPEPATLALFGAGLVGIGAVRRRRKAKA